jgi:hypothetical protein
MGFAGFAKPNFQPRHGLQLDGHVLHDVRRPSAAEQALEKPAANTHAATVLDHAGQPGLQALVETGQGVGRVVFQGPYVDPDFDGFTISPHIGAAQVACAQDLDVWKRHVYFAINGRTSEPDKG